MTRNDGPWVISAVFTPDGAVQSESDATMGVAIDASVAHDRIDWWNFILEFVPQSGINECVVLLIWDRPDGSQMPVQRHTVSRVPGELAIRTIFRVRIPYRWPGTLWLNVLVDGIPLTRSPFTVVHR